MEECSGVMAQRRISNLSNFRQVLPPIVAKVFEIGAVRFFLIDLSESKGPERVKKKISKYCERKNSFCNKLSKL